ncbi:flagellar basal body P-ring formation chaperone FlgA [Shewanella salipaludis]|uniref:Flagella basal body P-ring formation protein FlgA n=1 Tax=Shewanella salipaludis TaxID=2723052 RepID=A0A972FTS9_9GAMM|nr:flagellar basal body P-ring formation chaperone FlgA [Shewanella salipaludis]NMH65532.1 flagellar basal body P-ring formation protein FlgA [Shewanella salipaludis]
MKVNLLWLLITCFMPLAALAADEPVTPTISAIMAQTKAVVAKKITAPDNARVEITPLNLDSRLAPPRCSTAVTVELASDREISRNNTVKIGCNSPDLDYPWQVYVSVRVDILFPVVVATNILSAGDLITANELEIRYIDQTSLRGQQFAQPSEIVGTRVKHRVAMEAPILANNLCFVCKGDAISIFARSDAFEIKTLGEALRDGNLGDTIRVKNSHSGRELDARVSGIGEVEVRM